MNMLDVIFRPVILGFLFATWAVQTSGQSLSPPSPDAACSGQLSRAASYQVDFRVSIMPPANTESLRVWLPLPPSDNVQQITDREMNVFPRDIEPQIQAEPVFGNTFAYFDIKSPIGAQLISHRFKATVRQADWQLDYENVSAPKSWPSSFEPYRQPDPRIKEGNPLQEALDEIQTASVGGAPATQLISAMNWVDRNLTYDHVVASLTANPMHGLIHHRGHCSDYHGLCGTFAREIGFPSRVTYGLQMFDSGSPSHCKLEVFLPPYGWVCYDLSETQKLVIATAKDTRLTSQQRDARVAAIRERTMRGFRENTWLIVTRGTNYELSPPASRKVPLIRTIYVEADGQPLANPETSNPQQNVESWMTMYRVDGDNAAGRFQVID